MESSNQENNIVGNENFKTAKIIKTDESSINGQDKCPKCGATDISSNIKTGKLICNFCRHEFEPEKVLGMETDISKLSGEVLTSGVQNISSDSKDVITLKCSSCGAEVVIDTNSAMQSRCHWCRNTLSINEQIPNGSVPDVILPFQITKDVAQAQINNFVKKRNFFANPKFKKEFTTNNIMGVYFPYMVVDVNAHSFLSGQGEHLVRSYTRGSKENQRTYYDADLYNVEREFDLVINGLTIESNSKRLTNSSDKTNNIINSIMPFDIENCIKYNANYLKGYTSEKRDTNVEQLKELINVQSKDIARFSANDTLKNYNRGVCWSKEELLVKGEQWKAAYLPVWLYSYQQIKGNKKLLHYVAVNARTKETMGSVPIHIPKLLFVSFLVEIMGVIAMLFVDFDYNWLFLFSGFIYYIIIYSKYRNTDARHNYETETKTKTDNVRAVDNFVKQRKGLQNSHIEGMNNTKVNGGFTKGNNILKSALKKIK